MNYFGSIYILFPLLCLACAFSKRIRAIGMPRISVALLGLFFLLYSFSANGSDYEGYRRLYEEVKYAKSVFSVSHGEIGYSFLARVASRSGLSYHGFRMILLFCVTLVLAWFLYKRTPNFPLALFFITAMFVIYTISTYRQYIVMSFSFLWYDVYLRGKKGKALFGMALLMLFHIVAIVPFALLLADALISENFQKKLKGLFENHFIELIAAACLLRIVFFFILKIGFVQNILEMTIGSRTNTKPILVPFGLFSRTFFLFGIAVLFHLRTKKSAEVALLFKQYMAGILIYIMIPLEHFMGRLMNTTSFLLVALIPMLSVGERDHSLSIGKRRIKSVEKTLISAMIVVAFVILINQLINQDGYFPYKSFFAMIK